MAVKVPSNPLAHSWQIADARLQDEDVGTELEIELEIRSLEGLGRVQLFAIFREEGSSNRGIAAGTLLARDEFRMSLL